MEVEHIDQNSPKHKRLLQVSKQLVREKIPKWARKYRVPEAAWHLWEPQTVTLTKVGSHIPISDAMGPLIQDDANGQSAKDLDRYDQAIRILSDDGKSSQTIMEKPASLISVLANNALYAFRLYVLPLKRESFDTEQVRAEIRAELASLEWK